MHDVFTETLPNGLRLVLVPMPHLHSAELVAYIGFGSRDEADAEAGLAHFLEHLVFRGTAELPNTAAVERAFEEIGGSINASTDMETTTYYSRIHPQHVARGVELLASLLRRPLLEDVEAERRVILEEAREDINERGDDINPDNISAALLWPGHPLGRPVIGTPASLPTLDQAALRRAHASYYVPGNTVIAVTGHIDPAAVRAAVARVFGDWAGSPPRLPTAAVPLSPGPHTSWVRDSGSQVALQLAFRTPGRQDPVAMPLRLFRRILAWGGSSRLMQRLREELGLTYAVDADLLLLAETGSFAIDLAVTPERVEEAVAELLKLLEDACRQPAAEGEREAALRSYLYDLDFSRDLPDEMAVRYGWGLLAGCRRSLEEDRQTFAGITAAAMQAAARQILRPENMVLTVVGPWRKRDQKTVERRLREFRREG